MSFVYSALVIFVLFACIILIYYNENLYRGFYKQDWVNNVEVLLLFFSLSIMLLGFSCQIGQEKIKLLGPLLCLNLLFILLWVISLTLCSSFLLTILSSWIIFIITITTMLILALNKQKDISILTLPFLFMSILGILYSNELITKNPENPFNNLF